MFDAEIDAREGDMQIVTRRPKQAFRLGDSIEIVVLDIVGQQVRLGVKAPRHITVDREEIYRAKIGDAAGISTRPAV